jgi:hypothetical protein
VVSEKEPKAELTPSPYSGAFRSSLEILPAKIDSFSPASLPTTLISSPTLAKSGRSGIDPKVIYRIFFGSNLKNPKSWTGSR